MIIVAGWLDVDPAARSAYLDGCREVVRQALLSEGCLDFSISADLAGEGRIRIFERWDSRAAVESFRGAGPEGEQAAAILGASVAEFDVVGERSLS